MAGGGLASWMREGFGLAGGGGLGDEAQHFQAVHRRRYKGDVMITSPR